MSMRFDREDQVANKQVFPAAATVSQDSLKKPASQDLAYGKVGLALGIFPEADVTGTPTSILVEAIQADNAALTTNVQVLGSRVFLPAELARGEEQEVVIPRGKMTKEYIGARVTITGGTTPTTTLNMYYMPEGQAGIKYKSFPKVVDSGVN